MSHSPAILEADRSTANCGVEPTVDAVLLWVDGADPTLQAEITARRAAMGDAADRAEATYGTSASRFAQRDELRYTLRSIEKFAPFFRNIYLVTNGQVPAWLNKAHPRLRLTHHADFFPVGGLPTFHSDAIQSYVWRIPGIAEHFVLLDDDMCFLSPTSPADFYDAQGRIIVAADKRLVQMRSGDPTHRRAIATQTALARKLGPLSYTRIAHGPYAFTRSLMAKLWVTLPEELLRLSRTPFRRTDDIKVTSGAVQNMALRLDLAVARAAGNIYGYILLTSKNDYSRFIQVPRVCSSVARFWMRRRALKALCINDGNKTVDVPFIEHMVRRLYARLFPEKSAFEL